MFPFAEKFAAGLSYEAFLAKHGTDEYRRRWQHAWDHIKLSPAELELLASFKREMHVLCMAGAWCGDCVQQCPIFDHFARASDRIIVRYLDRDEHPDLRDELSICGGARVPVVVFLSEDDHEIGRYGDRTISTYRMMAAEFLGATCPSGLAVTQKSHLDAMIEDWLREFERVQLLLRLSPRLREKHGE